MKPKDMIGRIFVVTDASDYRLLLETDSGDGMETNKFVLVTPVTGHEGTNLPATLDFDELKR